MFIKVHKGTERYNGASWYLDDENLFTEYINADTIEEVIDRKTYAIIRTTQYTICVKESADDIMKIIGYFKVADDKWKLSENGDPTLDTPVAFFNTKDK